MLDIDNIRNDFPALAQEVHGRRLAYFDNGATTLKPRSVIEKLEEVYFGYNSNVHRGIHTLSLRMTEEYEAARSRVKQFINAGSEREIVFTSGTTASINTIAGSFSEGFLKEGDEIVLTAMEHHSNIVPWQLAAARKGAKIRVIPMNDNGELELNSLDSLINEKTAILAINHVSNALGTINPVKHIIEKAHEKDVPVLVDGAQAIPHGGVDVQELDCDFYVFSGHKVYGPNGIGVLYGKEEWLKKLPPWQGGGDMVKSVSFEKTTYADLPLKFEAGTSNYPGAVGLATALDYVELLGLEKIAAREKELLDYATQKLGSKDGFRIYGQAKEKISIVSFGIEGVHEADAAMVLDKLGLALRTGSHCAEPVMRHFGIEGTIRASLVFYNTIEEIDRLAEGIDRLKIMF